MEREAGEPGYWDDHQTAQQKMQQLGRLKDTVSLWRGLVSSSRNLLELTEMALAEDDSSLQEQLEAESEELTKVLAREEINLTLSGPYDDRPAIVTIHAGAGGTDAQDWAEMLLRMYLRWAEAQGFDTELIERSDGEVAGIKSATVRIYGDYAYGHLRTETGVHRLVRKSPFDSGNRRHTSFASVFAYPEVDDSIEIEINPADLRIDTYRASGAGGQHVNRTDSAVRITHLATGIVVQ